MGIPPACRTYRRHRAACPREARTAVPTWGKGRHYRTYAVPRTVAPQVTATWDNVVEREEKRGQI
eukprot:scaffold86412_cov46-Phaeocystis_antarctica.AAC.2